MGELLKGFQWLTWKFQSNREERRKGEKREEVGSEEEKETGKEERKDDQNFSCQRTYLVKVKKRSLLCKEEDKWEEKKAK